MNYIEYRFLPIAFVALALSACQVQPIKTLPTYLPKTPFVEAEFAWSAKPGEGEVTGQAFLKTKGGDVITCAGSDVNLLPKTRYTEELVAVTGGYAGARWDPEYPKYRRTTICDANGEFKFDQLPEGNWYVQTIVTWQAPTGRGLATQGSALRQIVRLSKAQKIRVILTDRDIPVN